MGKTTKNETKTGKLAESRNQFSYLVVTQAKI